MQTPHIVIHTEERGGFPPYEGYARVMNDELSTLLQRCRELSASLELEMEKRGMPGKWEPELRKTADKLMIMERLDDRALNNVDFAVKTLNSPQSKRDDKIYQDFLLDVLHLSNPGLVLLCAIHFGRQKISRMKEDDRVSLLKCIKVKKEFLSDPMLDKLANDNRIPESNSPQIVHILKKRKREDIPSSSVPLGDLLMPATKDAHMMWLPLHGEILPLRQYTNFSVMPLSKFEEEEEEHMPEPFRSGAKSSELWLSERMKSVNGTSCVNIFLPHVKADCLVLIRIGYEAGFSFSNTYGLGEKESSILS